VTRLRRALPLALLFVLGAAIPDGADACATEAAGVPDGDADDCRDIVPAVDRDRDGFPANQDCDDTNTSINPRATERPGNRIDENCDRLVAPFPRITAGVSTAGSSSTSRTKFQRLLVTEIPAGGKVQLRCTAPSSAMHACPFTRRSLRVRNGTSNGLSLLRKRDRRRGLVFGVGATLEVRIIAPNHAGKLVSYRITRRGFPLAKKRCRQGRGHQWHRPERAPRVRRRHAPGPWLPRRELRSRSRAGPNGQARAERQHLQRGQRLGTEVLISALRESSRTATARQVSRGTAGG
jgi:hypothetical protein